MKKSWLLSIFLIFFFFFEAVSGPKHSCALCCVLEQMAEDAPALCEYAHVCFDPFRAQLCTILLLNMKHELKCWPQTEENLFSLPI